MFGLRAACSIGCRTGEMLQPLDILGLTDVPVSQVLCRPICRMAHIVKHKVISRWGMGHGKSANGTWPAALPTSGLDCPIAAPSHADIRRFPCWIASGAFWELPKGRAGPGENLSMSGVPQYDGAGPGGCCQDGRKPNNPSRSRPRRGTATADKTQTLASCVRETVRPPQEC